MKFLLALALVFIQPARSGAQHSDSLVDCNANRVAGAKVRANPQKVPRAAAIKSAIVPGWGQVYNKKLWKVPIVYAALGATGGIFADNLIWYKRFRQGVKVVSLLNRSAGRAEDSSFYKSLNRLVLIYNEAGGIASVRVKRDQIRNDMHYSALYFLMAWALNIVDATVDAHLSGFDVSPDLSLNVQPGYSLLNKTAGLSLVVQWK